MGKGKKVRTRKAILSFLRQNGCEGLFKIPQLARKIGGEDNDTVVETHDQIVEMLQQELLDLSNGFRVILTEKGRYIEEELTLSQARKRRR